MLGTGNSSKNSTCHYKTFAFKNGIWNMLPGICVWIYSMVFGALADFLLTRGLLGKRNLRWLFHAIAFGIPAVTALSMGFTTENWLLTLCLFSFGPAFRGACYSGHTAVSQLLAVVFNPINRILFFSGPL